MKTIDMDMPRVNSLESQLRNTIRDIPDFPKPGIVFKDITPVLQDGKIFGRVIDALAEVLKDKAITHVVGIEARGFVFGSALAYKLGAGLIPARKKGKLPHRTITESYKLEYGEATLEIHADALGKCDNVVLVDDLLATGGTAAATAKLVERTGAKIETMLFVVELKFLNGRDILKNWDTRSLVSF